MAKKITYLDYLMKSIKWTVGNAIFGIFPLLFVWLLYGLSGGKTGHEELYRLIHDGVILFVCIAIMGAVVVEYLISGFPVSGFAVLRIYIFPLGVLGIVCIDFMLIQFKQIDNQCFDIDSLTTKIVVFLSLFYTIFTKASLYMKEDFRHEPI